MRMTNSVTQEISWLHKDMTMFHVQKCMKQSREKMNVTVVEPEANRPGGGDWRFELRIRYLPNDWSEVYEKDNITFLCYYNQVYTQFEKFGF